MNIILGADHRGFKLKELIKNHLNSSLDKEEKPRAEEFETIDVGASTYDPDDDYVDYAVQAATQLTEGDRAILFCGSGHGMDIVANRYPHIRAILGFNLDVIKQGREHEDANVLVIPGDWTAADQVNVLIESFINTPFSQASRHILRLKKLKKLGIGNW